MLCVAAGAQQKGPELSGLGVDVLSSVKVDAGTGGQRSQYVEVACCRFGGQEVKLA